MSSIAGPRSDASPSSVQQDKFHSWERALYASAALVSVTASVYTVTREGIEAKQQRKSEEKQAQRARSEMKRIAPVIRSHCDDSRAQFLNCDFSGTEEMLKRAAGLVKEFGEAISNTCFDRDAAAAELELLGFCRGKADCEPERVKRMMDAYISYHLGNSACSEVILRTPQTFWKQACVPDSCGKMHQIL